MAGTDVTSPSGQAPPADRPQRVSTLELFFDLVFVFTITQLTSYLARAVTLAAAGQVLLVFGLLWWMYGGYAWLTNARTPSRAPERLLLLLGMAGFLVIGLSIPHAFGANGSHGSDGVALGLGYLVVVGVHSALYLRINKNIWRLVPFNLASPVLLIIAGLTPAPAAYALWVASLAIQVLGPVFVRLESRFEIQPAHFVERHGALMIVAFGESVADVGIGAEGRPVERGPRAVRRARASAHRRALVDLLRHRRRRPRRGDAGGRAAGQAARARARRLLLRLHPDAARHRGDRRRAAHRHRASRRDAWRPAPRWRSPAGRRSSSPETSHSAGCSPSARPGTACSPP